MLNFITWDFDPVLFSIGDFEIRYYGLLWAASFWIGYTLVKNMYKKEGLAEKLMDPLLYSVLLGAVLGARLGHVFFYDYDWYFTANNPDGKSHLLSVLNIREGGLASHGGTIGVILAVWWYSRKRIHRSILFVMDKIVIPGALAGALIRLGNFLNHEIVGIESDKPWAVLFKRAGVNRIKDADNKVVQVIDLAANPRHPAQMYESISYAIVFVLLYFLYTKKQWFKKEGKLFGLFLMIVFTARFFIEFVKNSQDGFEELVDQALSTGQLLSIPFVLIGVYLFFTAKEKVAVD